MGLVRIRTYGPDGGGIDDWVEDGMEDEFDLTIPDFLDRKKNGIKPEPLPKNVSWKLKDRNNLVWPTEKQIAKAIRKREREKREDAASKIEIGSMRVRRGQ